MDALSEILRSMDMQHVALGTLELAAPWGLRMDDDFSVPTVYGMVSGPACWVDVPGRDALRMEVGDAILISGGITYSLSDGPNRVCADFGHAWRANLLPNFDPLQEPDRPLRFHWGDGNDKTLLLGFAFRLVDRFPGPVFGALPDVTFIRSSDGYFPWVGPAVAYLAREEGDRQGYVFTARLLVELMFVSILRHHLASRPEDARGWLRGLSDPAVAAALQAIHSDPAIGWTVRSLAREARVSRTALATRFNNLVGMPPIQYLSSWRMYLAATRLRQPKTNLSQLAFQLGYTSDAAFRDAFRRSFGQSPSDYRRYATLTADR